MHPEPRIPGPSFPRGRWPARSLTPLAAILLLVAFSPPARGQFKGAWLPPKPALDFKLGLYYSETDAWFCGPNLDHCHAGERTLLNPLAESQSSTLITQEFELQVMPIPGVALHLYIPVHDITFKETVVFPGTSLELEGDGLGDITVLLRGGVTPGHWSFTGSYGVMFPTAPFTTNSFEITVGRGTRNHWFMLEVGRSLWPRPLYLQGGLLYLVREIFTNEFGVEIDWGNELHARLEGGWNPHRPWWLVLEAKGFRSGARRILNIPGERDDQYRSWWALAPKVVYRWTPNNWVELWATFPITGRNTPADPTVGTAIYTRFELYNAKSSRSSEEPLPGTLPDQ